MQKIGILIFGIFLLVGCGAKAPHTIIPDYAKKTTRLVALLPVDNRTNDQSAATMLREKMLEELYFKGYPKIPLDVIDSKLRKHFPGNINTAAGNISPKAIGELLEVDAVMYCTLRESKNAIRFFYTSTSMSTLCELRSGKTGETIWKAEYGVVERRLGHSRYDLGMKASQVYEAAIQEVVDKIMETLPDGPDLLG